MSKANWVENTEMTKRAKVINIMSFPPPYELYHKEPTPEIHWRLTEGRWVGIWSHEIPDLLGNEILRVNNDFEYEVWQSDARADVVYSHAFGNGLTHRLLPAIQRRELVGIKLIRKIFPRTAIAKLSELSLKERIILQLDGPALYDRAIIDALSHLPIVVRFGGTIHLPATRMFRRRKNIVSIINDVSDQIWLRKKVNSVDCIFYQNDVNVEHLRKIYRGELVKATAGIDFSSWYQMNGKYARKRLGLPLNKKIFFSACTLKPLKQVDKLIRTFVQISDQYDFLLVIAGHGTSGYESYIRRISEPLVRKNKLRFVGYIRGQELLWYYNASDFFLSSSLEEGGPGSVIKALACGIPVISTRVGNTAELMEQHKCGCLLDIHDYAGWKSSIEEVLAGKRVVRALARAVAREHYGWPAIANKYLDVYKRLVNKYYA